MTTKNDVACIGTLALEAMLVEVSVTPKPGLVDRNNSGAHRDMSFFTFMRSAASLRSCFEGFAKSGFRAGCDGLEPSEIFPELRAVGLEAEGAMFRATGGINTHKGEIFSLGVMSACAGYLAGREEAITSRECVRGDKEAMTSWRCGQGDKEARTSEGICELAGRMCAGLCERDFREAQTKSHDHLTKGELIYLEHGISGIRGEAENGYPVVRNAGLPALVKYLAEGLSMNDALVMTLMRIMEVNDDTNIIARHGLSVLEEVKRISGEIIDVEEAKRLDDEFIARNISPSGSADLLAVTYFIYELQQA